MKLPPIYAHPDLAAVRARLAALQGFAPAQSSLALPYLTGAGVPVDRIEARAWLLLASTQGERDARDLAPGVRVESSDAKRQPARDRASRYRRAL